MLDPRNPSRARGRATRPPVVPWPSRAPLRPRPINGDRPDRSHPATAAVAGHAAELARAPLSALGRPCRAIACPDTTAARPGPVRGQGLRRPGPVHHDGSATSRNTPRPRALELPRDERADVRAPGW